MPVTSKRNSPLAIIKRTLLPGLSQIIGVTGTTIRCKEAVGVFYVQLDDDAEFPLETGIGVQLQEPDFFTRVTLTNKTAASMNIELWVSNKGVVDNRLNTRFDRNNPVYVKDAPTRLLSNGIITMNVNDIVQIPERVYGFHRKQLLIYNVTGGSTIAIWSGPIGGNELFRIKPDSGFTIFTSGEVYIKNIGGAINTVDILETVYYQ